MGEGAGDHGDTQGGLRALLPVLTRHHCPQGYRATEQRSPGGLPMHREAWLLPSEYWGKERSREQ